MYDDDLFQEQVKQEAKNMVRDLISSAPTEILDIIDVIRKERDLVLSENQALLKKNTELQISASKWAKFLDSEGLLDMAEVADKLKIPYLDKKGNKKTMGNTKFGEVLRMHNIILKRNNGYGIHSQAPKVIKENSKTVSKITSIGIVTSVKFSAKALEYLDNKYSDSAYIWHVNSEGRLYCE